MLQKNDFPVLEFDDDPSAKLNPAHFSGDGFDTDKMVITFFPEVIEKLLLYDKIRITKTISGENPLIIYRFMQKPDVLLALGSIGCPACGGNLDLFNAMGRKKVMFCGGGGVLDKNIDVGQILVETVVTGDNGDVRVRRIDFHEADGDVDHIGHARYPEIGCR